MDAAVVDAVVEADDVVAARLGKMAAYYHVLVAKDSTVVSS